MVKMVRCNKHDKCHERTSCWHKKPHSITSDACRLSGCNTDNPYCYIVDDNITCIPVEEDDKTECESIW